MPLYGTSGFDPVYILSQIVMLQVRCCTLRTGGLVSHVVVALSTSAGSSCSLTVLAPLLFAVVHAQTLQYLMYGLLIGASHLLLGTPMSLDTMFSIKSNILSVEALVVAVFIIPCTGYAVLSRARCTVPEYSLLPVDIWLPSLGCMRAAVLITAAAVVAAASGAGAASHVAAAAALRA